MPPVSRLASTDSGRVWIASLALLAILSGCGRGRSESDSAGSAATASAPIETASVDQGFSNDIPATAAPSESGERDFKSATSARSMAPPLSIEASGAGSFTGPIIAEQSSRLKMGASPSFEGPQAETAGDEPTGETIGSIDTNFKLQSPNSMSDLTDEVGKQPSTITPPPTVGHATSTTAKPSVVDSPANPSAADLPAGSTAGEDGRFTTVPVYYATDRQRDPVPLSAYEVTGNFRVLSTLVGCLLCSMVACAVCGWRGHRRIGALSSVVACVSGSLAAICVFSGNTGIIKRGVHYRGDRGSLTRGICEVTVPKIHRPGIVERPSVFRLEFREDQEKHIVLTSAIELSQDDFYSRLSQTVSKAPDQDLLVFIHGYNVDFQSAVRRTAQIAVDLPFEGVPICYSWPSQGTLLGYSIDETNAEWTTTHLQQFLMELVDRSGAKSINVIAHSMGNRPMTAAMEQIRWRHPTESLSPFDRVVLAAPDVDADRFRRDLGPSLSKVANQVTLYASSNDQALIASKQVHGYPRAGESGDQLVVVPGVETIDVSGIDLSLLGHSYYGDSESMLRDLYQVVRSRLSAPERSSLIPRQLGDAVYWQLALQQPGSTIR